MERSTGKMAYLFAASILAVIGLIVFQLMWMNHSKKLAEEIFNQRVCLALCSAVENFCIDGMDNSQLVSCGNSGSGCTFYDDSNGSFLMPYDFSKDPDFNRQLKQSLRFHKIDLDYDLNLSPVEIPPFHEKATYSCVLPLNTNLPVGMNQTYLHLIFPDKDALVLKEMSLMIATTVLILIFTAGVLFYGNWSLLQQKRLLKSNVEFFNIMAHEFKTPLANMGLATNLFLKKNPEQKDDNFIGILKKENGRLLEQVERILHLASLKNGGLDLQKEQVDLKKLVYGVYEDMMVQIEDRKAKVIIGNIPDNTTIIGDAHHLANVLRNLLDNALKYCQKQPEIVISAQKSSNGVIISVQDNGQGFPPEKSKWIFEKFKRATKYGSEAQGGFGLGLTYVKSIIEHHKGFVQAVSKQNEGSVFEVFLPILS